MAEEEKQNINIEQSSSLASGAETAVAYTSSTKRIARNTLMLYFRQILIMLVSLYTVRVVLSTLGAEDYGIYNVVAGVVVMFGFLSGAMATASQRFFSFELGRGDTEKLKRTFSVTLCIYLLLILTIVALAETVGLWFVNRRLVIPEERMRAARWVYQLSIANFAVTLMTAPYMAAIIAHEDMGVYAYASIVETALKLAVVFLLKILPYDKLVVYGLLLLCVGVVNTSIYRLYCRRHYGECAFRPVWDKAMFKNMFSFTVWSIFGAFTTTLRIQATTILVNQFFSPVVVAARAISVQVTNAMNIFSTNFNTSLYAPIVKEYASGQNEKMYSLIFNGCKMTFLLMWIFALPLCLRMEYVLSLWLKDIPDYTSVFSILAAIEVLINSVSLPIMTAARAGGRVRLYELVLGTMQTLMFVCCFIWLKFFDGGPMVVYWLAIILNVAMFFARLFIVHMLVDLPLGRFLMEVIAPVLSISILSSVPAFCLNRILPQNFLSLCAVVVISLCASSSLMLLIGMSKQKRREILNRIFGGCA